MNYRQRYNYWCTSAVFDSSTREELAGITGDEAEIRDRFYRDLEIGTGGFRGLIGAGTNRMNFYTAGRITQGLADYLLARGTGAGGTAIAFDSRHCSRELAARAAGCLNANGIPAFVYGRPVPTPMLSYAVRYSGCAAGIMITASHNPAPYNGYKIYMKDGSQISGPEDVELAEYIDSIHDYGDIRFLDRRSALKRDLYHEIGMATEEAYYREIEGRVLNPGAVRTAGSKIKIVYTALHGTGNEPVTTILARLGFRNVYSVAKQQAPDGNFPTVTTPNPEEPEAFGEALKLAQKVAADLILATDPDADRLGVYVKGKENEYHTLNGNMTGILLCDYLLAERKKRNLLKKDSVVIKTIVSTPMAEALTKHYQTELVEVLTGFKYIGKKIREYELSGKGTFEFGFEESHGYLTGDFVRDKDGVSAAAAFCEMAAFYYTQGFTVWEKMMALYRFFGFYKEAVDTVTFPGAAGQERIKELMESLRKNPPGAAGDYQVVEVEDYLHIDIGLPPSDVLRFKLLGQAWFWVRPSGTEPKIKYYYGVTGDDLADAENKLAKLREAVKSIIHPAFPELL